MPESNFSRVSIFLELICISRNSGHHSLHSISVLSDISCIGIYFNCISLLQFMILLRNHGWLLFEAFTESYNETMEADTTTLASYLAARPGKYNLL